MTPIHLKDIERLTRHEIPVVQIEGFEPDPRIKAEPIQNGQNRGRGGQNGNPKKTPGKSLPVAAP